MSTISSLSSNHPVSLELPTYTNSQLLLCINSSQGSKQDILPTPLITPQSSTSFDNDSSNEFIQRLYYQKSKLIKIYDSAIEHGQPTSQLINFLDKIDQLMNVYENDKSTISNYVIIFINNLCSFVFRKF